MPSISPNSHNLRQAETDHKGHIPHKLFFVITQFPGLQYFVVAIAIHRDVELDRLLHFGYPVVR